MVTTDLLARLIQDGRVAKDIAKARPGSLVMAQGTILFVDRNILELAEPMFEAAIKQEKSKPQKTRDKAFIENFQLIGAFMSKIRLPAAFWLRVDDAVQIAGTIKELGLDEPISAFYFKYGQDGIADVYVLGVKEHQTTLQSHPSTQFMATSQQLAEALKTLLFPPEALRVTPVAIFRKIEQT